MKVFFSQEVPGKKKGQLSAVLILYFIGICGVLQ